MQKETKQLKFLSLSHLVLLRVADAVHFVMDLAILSKNNLTFKTRRDGSRWRHWRSRVSVVCSGGVEYYFQQQLLANFRYFLNAQIGLLHLILEPVKEKTALHLLSKRLHIRNRTTLDVGGGCAVLYSLT